MTIDKAISSSSIRDFSRPLKGDCASVAAGLKAVFGGQFVCLYADREHSSENLPAHVLIEVDGVLYDGTGAITKQEAFEIHLVMNDFAVIDDDCDDYFVYEAPPEYMIDEEIKMRVITELDG